MFKQHLDLVGDVAVAALGEAGVFQFDAAFQPLLDQLGGEPAVALPDARAIGEAGPGDHGIGALAAGGVDDSLAAALRFDIAATRMVRPGRADVVLGMRKIRGAGIDLGRAEKHQPPVRLEAWQQRPQCFRSSIQRAPRIGQEARRLRIAPGMNDVIERL
jgi:hypothetical protein